MRIWKQLKISCRRVADFARDERITFTWEQVGRRRPCESSRPRRLPAPPPLSPRGPRAPVVGWQGGRAPLHDSALGLGSARPWPPYPPAPQGWGPLCLEETPPAAPAGTCGSCTCTRGDGAREPWGPAAALPLLRPTRRTSAADGAGSRPRCPGSSVSPGEPQFLSLQYGDSIPRSYGAEVRVGGEEPAGGRRRGLRAPSWHCPPAPWARPHRPRGRSSLCPGGELRGGKALSWGSAPPPRPTLTQVSCPSRYSHGPSLPPPAPGDLDPSPTSQSPPLGPASQWHRGVSTASSLHRWGRGDGLPCPLWALQATRPAVG